ncbi:AH receptor-interacting protein [Procambarus clarkii]|uniref:AH receptor-interacting protein n=1 Tax=Procambarus clarkii TaxID=6728 RepID=UPI001E672E16|nr:AH receptor-interacting protein-like [Procambarus clarkii]XP_045584097.1 AH receptor-interacting protein-like [Procambarus clarkii]XP_045584098.1 AH receptor-interacting protein-like [Procambarus clarkii]
MDNGLIKKKILYQGKGKSDYNDGTKVTFHIKTETCEDSPQLIDDSHRWSKPVELILGKKFKLEVLEACIHTMILGEVASFTIDKSLLSPYPLVSKTLREAYGETKVDKEKKPHHCCGMGFKEGLGYQDLDELVKTPKDLKFTIELVKVAGAGSYEKEFWAMTESERLESIPALKEQGNALYKERNYEAASKAYSEALGRLEQLMLREKPNDEEWLKLNEMKMPLLLNFSQCQLIRGEYYAVIEHCTTVLEKDPDNVKALYRRGRAYVEVFSPAEARKDLEKAARLDATVSPGCRKLLSQLANMESEKTMHDRSAYKKLFSSS